MKNKDRYTLPDSKKVQKLADQQHKCANPFCDADLLKPSDAIFDHRVPIWKRPPGQRRWTPEEEYDGQDGLCPPCSAVKTSKEAAERAHYKRLEAVEKGRKNRHKKRKEKYRNKIPSRGFDKRYKRDWKTGKTVRRDKC